MSNNLPWNNQKPRQPYTKTGEEICICGGMLLDHWVYQEGRPSKRGLCGMFEFADVNGWADYERKVGNPDYLLNPTFWRRQLYRFRRWKNKLR